MGGYPMRVEKFLVNVDKAMDYIPFASTVNNAVDLIAKGVFKTMKREDLDLENRYVFHVINKNAWRSAILLLPVIGNIIVAISDLKKKHETEAKNKAAQEAVMKPDLAEEDEFKLVQDYMGELNQRLQNLQTLSSLIDERKEYEHALEQNKSKLGKEIRCGVAVEDATYEKLNELYDKFRAIPETKLDTSSREIQEKIEQIKVDIVTIKEAIDSLKA